MTFHYLDDCAIAVLRDLRGCNHLKYVKNIVEILDFNKFVFARINVLVRNTYDYGIAIH